MSFISNSRNKLSSWFVTCLLTLGLGACGGGSGEQAGINGATGRVAVMLTDGPTAEFQQINITVTAIHLLGANGPQTLYTGSETIDLLSLYSHSEMFALADILPGNYGKIRLTVSDVELVRQDDSGAVIERIHPKLPGNGKLDLVPRSPISVMAGQTLYLQLDMDAEKSIHIVETGNGKYVFRPVIFVDVLSADLPGKLVRLHGDIQEIDLLEQRFLLCHPTLIARHLRDEKNDHSNDDDGSFPQSTPAPRCITVQTDEHTSIFDTQADPVQLSDLNSGDEVTVLGRFLPSAEDDHWMVLQAAVIEAGPIGTYAQLRGEVTAVAPDHGSFELTLNPGQGFAAGTVLQVQLQDGTQIFTRQGTPLSPEDIVIGEDVKVEGVVLLSDTEADQIKAVLVFVDTDASDGPVSGTVGGVDLDHHSFTLITTSGDRCVSLSSGAHIYLIDATAGGFVSVSISLSDLNIGQQVDVYGPLGLSGCYLAHDVLATPL